MWYGQDVMRYKLFYEMIMFCWSYRQLAEALWLSLYCIRCKCHIIALLYHYAITIVAKAIVGKTTLMQRWRSKCRAGDDGDHDDALEMEIKSTRWWWPYHVTYFDCMWCLSFMHLILLKYDGSIIRWSLTKIARYKCSPRVCTIAKVLRAETPRDDRVW